MRRYLIAALCGLACVAAAPRLLEACGDKLLMVGRGLRFQRAYASEYPGTIVIYARATASAKAAIRDSDLQKNLRQAGHSVSVIENSELFAQALRTVPVDVVLADVADAPMIEPLAQASASRPAVRYVSSPAANAETKRLQQQYACPLKPSDNTVKYLDVIEDAMKARVGKKPGAPHAR